MDTANRQLGEYEEQINDYMAKLAAYNAEKERLSGTN